METRVFFFIFIVSSCVAFVLKFLHDFFFPKLKLPPGPAGFPFIGNIHWIRTSYFELEPILRKLHAKYGPIVTLQFGTRPAIFISDNSLAYKALIQNGAVFADRPRKLLASRILNSNQRDIISCPQSPTWRVLRRNLTAEILNPSRLRSHSGSRRLALEMLMSQLRAHSDGGTAPIRVIDHFHFTMFCLVVRMCLGDKLEENQIHEIESMQQKVLVGFRLFNSLNLLPWLGKILFRKRWKELVNLRTAQIANMVPYVRARRKLGLGSSSKDHILTYADTLLDLQLPEGKMNLNDEEIVTLCAEFMGAGSETTANALQWIMANLVKYPHIQRKLFEEISGVMAGKVKEVMIMVMEEDLQKMPYLKAVVLEGLRRHPPPHFLLPHAVTHDVTFAGYDIPKNATLHFEVAAINWNPSVWEDPMEFKPERFFKYNDNMNGEAFDVTGSRDIKMLTFGSGRRMCPGHGMAVLHLEYFVANLVYNFEWKAVEGDEVDLSEQLEFTVVMKNPLQARIYPRIID